LKTKKIFYWSPFFGKVATVYAVINSAESFSKYSQLHYQPYIVDCFNEWGEFNYEINKKKINIIKLNKKIHYNVNIHGFFKSRFLYIIAFIISFFKLKKLLESEKPEFLIIHLLTSLPIILYAIFNFDTKLILRISGLPKLNLFRRTLWKFFSKNLKAIITPTEETKNILIKEKIFDEKKIFHLKDPIINIQKIKVDLKKINEHIKYKKAYFAIIGRYTKQKNHMILIKAIKEMKNELKDYEFYIVGYGELKKNYVNYIKQYELDDHIKLIDYTKDIYSIIKHSKCIISTSLWEDPGWIMIEASSMGIPVISSDCPNGPKEFLDNNKCGLLFKNNSIEDLKKIILHFINLPKKSVTSMTLSAKKKSKYYTKYHHYKNFSKILDKTY